MDMRIFRPLPLNLLMCFPAISEPHQVTNYINFLIKRGIPWFFALILPLLLQDVQQNILWRSKFLSVSAITEIPSAIQTIGSFAFAGCKNLKEIVLPASVKYIEERAFADCKALKKLVLPDGIESIGKEAFLRCAKLTNAGLKGSTKKGYSFEFPWQTEIPENAFSGMNKLQKVVLPETIVYIGKGAFKGCKALTEINLPENVKCDKKAFKDCTKLSI